ncbi:type II toxin-antitoxin system RelE/ParE family toxin [Bifidobacterium sp. wkB338]|uniref:type II toxin-antitoxin system RelE/ParE family toxin n=1 Tax=Bifidobacterium sp. wkB338 TaxID=2025114 RepID=UPI001C7D73BA|nr:type II toxin-antitoxin system RelE/ParE family toxin [Bifidobacterium sp. wkB338]
MPLSIIEVLETEEFSRWIDEMKDTQSAVRILHRWEQVKLSWHLSEDWKTLGEGVFEMRFHYGPGYHTYFSLKNRQVVLLLCGGSKAHQKRDIDHAKHLWKSYLES